MQNRFTRLAVVGSIALLLTGTAACQRDDSTSGSSSNAGGMIAQLNMGDFGGGNAPQANYNPFSPTALTTTFTFEPLFVMNKAKCELTPWLGTSYDWASTTKLVVQTRSGVKWSDGKPFSAKDVAFTFNMLKKSPALDVNGLWAKLSSVSAAGDSTVNFEFKEPAIPTLAQISDVRIVPEHVWAKEADPAKFTNTGAVGTGPFKVKSMNGQQLVLERNATYWQADKIKIQRLMFKKATGGAEVDKLRLARGEYDWNAMFVPEVEKTFVAKDPKHNKYWFPPGGLISIYMNLTKAPFDDVEFRKAVAYAINREEIKNKAQFGYVETASQTGLVVPAQKDWLAPGIENDGKIPYDPAEAKKILADAGYKTVGGKLAGKDGKPLPTFSFKTPNGWVDWVQAAQIIQKNLRDIGIEMQVQTPSFDVVNNDRQTGNFEMAFEVFGGGCNIYQAYNNLLASSQTAPIGKPAATNVERWKDPKTDELIGQLAKAEDEAQQKQIVHQLQQIMVEEYPVVPLWYGAIWYEYRTAKAVGWPSKENQTSYPDDHLLVITKLRPATGG